MKRPLPCLDLDPADPDPDRLLGNTCRSRYLALTQGVKFACPNKGGTPPCEAGAFLYPRKRTDAYFHFHQGIDLGQLAPGVEEPTEGHGAEGMPILSVTDGLVVHTQEWDGVSSGYGTSVGIYHRDSERLYWYAHCLPNSITVSPGQQVSEGQVIARVGSSGKAGKPHLHFEVIASRFEKGRPEFTRIVGGKSWERELGSKKGPRLDPLQVLAELGPWGPRQVFAPLGPAFEPELVERLHDLVEVRSYGGYFPLGANNFWHGGVHLPTAEGSDVYAPCDGTIVAARLAPDEASGSWRFGHTSFILIRHEVPRAVHERMQGQPDGATADPKPAKSKGEKGGRIGVGYKVVDPDAVNRVKARLHELGYYAPEDPARRSDGEVEAELGEAIEAFQRTISNPRKKQPELWPDGVIDVPGHTWDHLFPSEEASDVSAEAPGSDPKRTIYCLLMHLQPLTLKAARAAGIEWVERARLPSGADAPAEAPADQEETPKEELRDREEADSHRIKADVHPGSTNTADVEWVERRLITLGFLTTRSEPTGAVDAELEAAIKAFQAEHPWAGNSANCDGVVEKGGKTDKFLRKTAFELAARKQGAPGGEKHDPVDPAFAAAVAKLDRFGLAEVVSGLDVRVVGGKPLWKSGRASGFNEGGGQELRQEIHWEVFSEELLLPRWDVIDDQDDDLDADLPATLMERIDLVPDEIVMAPEIFMFYQSDACHELRRTACRFRSEWNLDIDRAIGRLDELGFNTFGLREGLEPYPWWDKARDVLPPNVSHVWHYNPIEFFRVYQEALEVSKPAPPPAPRDPETHGELIVRVRAANGMPPKQPVTVSLSYEMASYAGASTGKSGTAHFQGLALGTYDVSLEGIDGVSQIAEVQGYTTTEVTLETPLEGQPEQRCDLTVWVRKATGGAAVGAQVTIEGDKLDREFGTLEVGKKSTVLFHDLRSGDYRVRVVYPANPSHPNELVEADATVTLEGIKKKMRVTVPRGWSDVVVQHDDGGVTVAGTVTDAHGAGSMAIATDGAGQARFRVRLGKYKISLGGRKKTVEIRSPAMELRI